MACKAATEVETVDEGWNVQTSMTILRWIVQHDGGLSLQWKDMVPKAWGIFFSNLRQKGWKKLGFQRRLLILNRSVRPFILRALSAWAPTPHYVDELNKLQRRMVSKLTNLFIYPLETWRAFRSRAASSVTQAISWDKHLTRNVCIMSQKFA